MTTSVKYSIVICAFIFGSIIGNAVPVEDVSYKDGSPFERLFSANGSYQIFNESFWKELFPSLHIYDKEFAKIQEGFAVNPLDTEQIRNTIQEEGYVQFEPQPWQLSLDTLVDTIDQMHKMGIPITFSYLFDEYWYMFALLNQQIETILGPGYLRQPDFWTWRVDPKNTESGWKVHRDKSYRTLYTDGMPKTVSVWIPLTDATPSNGCMYILPANRDPTYNQEFETLTKHFTSIAQDIRALPAKAGGFSLKCLYYYY
jgi:hypothetical protein